ncbi:MAG: hypothetical protein WC144_00080 [Sulfurimonas sp.]|jgi:hypothetical protein|nr:hypothetical protein [Sulfurimonadaceae bacterium]
MSSLPNTLNSYWLYKEITSKLGLSNPTYKYWSGTKTLKLNNKYLFLQKNTLPQKYEYVEEILTDLSGYLPIRFASDRLHTSQRIFSYEKMRLYKEFEYKFVEDIKFVNIRRFFKEFGIKASKDSIIHLGRLDELEISANTTFYNLKNDYGVVVYN